MITHLDLAVEIDPGHPADPRDPMSREVPTDIRVESVRIMGYSIERLSPDELDALLQGLKEYVEREKPKWTSSPGY